LKKYHKLTVFKVWIPYFKGDETSEIISHFSFSFFHFPSCVLAY
jgi:hypothetical protein